MSPREEHLGQLARRLVSELYGISPEHWTDGTAEESVLAALHEAAGEDGDQEGYQIAATVALDELDRWAAEQGMEKLKPETYFGTEDHACTHCKRRTTEDECGQ